MKSRILISSEDATYHESCFGVNMSACGFRHSNSNSNVVSPFFCFISASERVAAVQERVISNFQSGVAAGKLSDL